MNNEKKQTEQLVSENPGSRSITAAKTSVQFSYETAVLKALQEKASLLGKSYQYGGYQGL